MKEVRFEPGMKEQGGMDGESGGETMEETSWLDSLSIIVGDSVTEKLS